MLPLDSSIVSPPPPPLPTPHEQLGQNLVLERAEKYAHATRALAPLALTFSSREIVFTLQALHLPPTPIL